VGTLVGVPVNWNTMAPAHLTDLASRRLAASGGGIVAAALRRRYALNILAWKRILERLRVALHQFHADAHPSGRSLSRRHPGSGLRHWQIVRGPLGCPRRVLDGIHRIALFADATDLPIITLRTWSFCMLKAITAPPAINSGWTWMFRSDVAALYDAWGQRPGHEVMS
jgi:hypothetical protein